MAYKCKNCGKFVAKDAAVCNYILLLSAKS